MRISDWSSDVCSSDLGARLVQAAGQRLVERLDDERRLAAAGDAGDAGEGAERNRRIDLLQVVRGGAEDADLLARVALAAQARYLDLAPAREVLPGQALRVLHALLGLAAGDHPAPVPPGARAHVATFIGPA